MKKELLMILLLLGLPTVFVMYSEGFASTGAVSNEFAEIRKDRVELYLNFPVIVKSPLTAKLTNGVREYLRAGAHEDFYAADRLKFGDRFFDNEKVLVGTLLKLVCLKPVGEPKGRFVTLNGMDVIMLQNRFFYTPYEDFAGHCDKSLASASEDVLKSVLALDVQLVKKTVDVSACPDLAKGSLKDAEDNIVYGNLEYALNDLRTSWLRATGCS